jgi:hypothetical protein
MLGATITGAVTEDVSIPPYNRDFTPNGARDWKTGEELIRTCMATHETATLVLFFLIEPIETHVWVVIVACLRRLHTLGSLVMEWTTLTGCRRIGTSKGQCKPINTPMDKWAYTVTVIIGKTRQCHMTLATSSGKLVVSQPFYYLVSCIFPIHEALRPWNLSSLPTD